MNKMNDQEKYDFMFRFVGKLDICDFLDLMDVIYSENDENDNKTNNEDKKSGSPKASLKLTPLKKFKF